MIPLCTFHTLTGYFRFSAQGDFFPYEDVKFMKLDNKSWTLSTEKFSPRKTREGIFWLVVMVRNLVTKLIWLLIGCSRVNNQSEAESASWPISWPWLQLIRFRFREDFSDYGHHSGLVWSPWPGNAAVWKMLTLHCGLGLVFANQYIEKMNASWKKTWFSFFSHWIGFFNMP